MKYLVCLFLVLTSCTTQVKTIRYPSGKEVTIVDKQSVEIKKMWISVIGEILKTTARNIADREYSR